LLTESQPVQKEGDEFDWSSADDADQPGGGERLDNHSHDSLQLAYEALAKFPELRRRYQKFIGTAAVLSTGVVVLASIAVTRRLHRGQNPARILAEITPDEIENAAKAVKAPEKPKKKPRGKLFHH
jgi:hypothetical protein